MYVHIPSLTVTACDQPKVGPDYVEVRNILFKSVRTFVGNHQILAEIVRNNVDKTRQFGSYVDYYSRTHRKLQKSIINDYERITGKVYGKAL